MEQTFASERISCVERISGDSLIHILRFMSEDFYSFVNLLNTSKRLHHLATTNERILLQIEMRKKYDVKAPLFAAVHQGVYLECRAISHMLGPIEEKTHIASGFETVLPVCFLRCKSKAVENLVGHGPAYCKASEQAT